MKRVLIVGLCLLLCAGCGKPRYNDGVFPHSSPFVLYIANIGNRITMKGPAGARTVQNLEIAQLLRVNCFSGRNELIVNFQ